MKAEDLERYSTALVDAFNNALAVREAGLLARIAALEARAPIPGPAGKDGRDGLDGKDGSNGVDGKDGAAGLDGKNGLDGVNGKDADVDTLVAITCEKVKALIPEPLPGKDGAPGKDGEPGKDAPPVDTEAVIKAVVAQIPTPKDGKDGIDGKDGADGLNGKDGTPGADGKDGANGVDGKDGRDGINGKDGKDGLSIKGDPGEAGRPGIDGKDGRDGVAGADGANGLNGKDGRDGFSLKDFSVEPLEDGRTIQLKFVGQDVNVIEELTFPIPIYRGEYTRERREEIKSYDCLTFGNETWIAKVDTPTSDPGLDPNQWDRMARKGRDGRDRDRSKEFNGTVKL